MEIFLSLIIVCILGGKYIHDRRERQNYDAELKKNGIKRVYIGSGILKSYYFTAIDKEAAKAMPERGE